VIFASDTKEHNYVTDSKQITRVLWYVTPAIANPIKNISLGNLWKLKRCVTTQIVLYKSQFNRW
jgi:hypothetical protein